MGTVAQYPAEALELRIANIGSQVWSSDGERNTTLHETIVAEIKDVDRGQGTQYMATPKKYPHLYAVGPTSDAAFNHCLRNIVGLA